MTLRTVSSPPKTNRLTVLELGGTAKLTPKAYAKYHELQMPDGAIQLHAVDKKFEARSELICRTSAVEVFAHGENLFSTEFWPRKRKMDHVHFHMVDGGFARMSDSVFVIDESSLVLKRGGYFFLSLDYHFFSDHAYARQPAPHTPFAFISEVLKTQFEILMQHYDAAQYLSRLSPFMDARRKMVDGDQQVGIARFCTPGAEAIAKSFGFELPLAENPVKFFELFSEDCGNWGAYFAIAQKK